MDSTQKSKYAFLYVSDVVEIYKLLPSSKRKKNPA